MLLEIYIQICSLLLQLPRQCLTVLSPFLHRSNCLPLADCLASCVLEDPIPCLLYSYLLVSESAHLRYGCIVIVSLQSLLNPLLNPPDSWHLLEDGLCRSSYDSPTRLTPLYHH